MSDTRAQAAEKLLEHFQEPYRISRQTLSGGPLIATATMHYVGERRLLSLAKMGTVESDDFVYVYSLDSLTLPLYESLCEEALRDGLSRVDPNPNHNFSLISLFFLCDHIAPDAASALKKKKFHQKYKKPEAGWADLRMTAVEVSSGTHVSNPMGRDLYTIYKTSVL